MKKGPSGSLPLLKRLLYELTNWSFFAAGLVNLGIGTWCAVNDDVAIAATSLTAGLVLLFAATIDRFESVKGLGVEAKTRQLDEKIEQADDALRRLKELTEITGGALIDLNSKMGRWDSAPPPRATYALAQKVRSIMESLGSDAHAVESVLKPWLRSMCGDLAAALVAPMQELLRTQIRELENQRSAIPSPLRPDDPDLLRTNAAIRDGSAYRERLNKSWKFELDEYPERFVQLFDDVPLVPPELVSPIRAKALAFAPAMVELREELKLSNPELWFAEIEQHRNK